MRIIILDENNNEVSFNDSDFKLFTPSEPVLTDFSVNYLNLINNLKQEISIFIPYEDGTDFIVMYLSNEALKSFGISSNKDVAGCLMSKSLKLVNDRYIMDLFKEVYKTGETRFYQLMIYDDNDQLKSYYFSKIIKDGSKLFLLTENLTEEKRNEIVENDLMDNATNGLIILQDGVFKSVNKKYCQLMGCSPDDMLNQKYTFNNPEFSLSPEDIQKLYDKLENRETLVEELEYSFLNKNTGKKNLCKYCSISYLF